MQEEIIQQESLEDKCLRLRKKPEQSLENTHVLMMLDGRSFSKLIKNKFNKPFDDDFIDMMNQTAVYLCQNISGCRLAYVQSDEISLYINSGENPNAQLWFGGRMCKMLSIAAAMAASKFNQLYTIYRLKEDISLSGGDVCQQISEMALCEFDCKAWNVDSANDAFAWFLYRQNDCIRNSKQQTAQTWLSHKALMGKLVDEQIVMLKESHGIDWNEYEDSKKFGRFIYKETELFHNDKMNIDYERSVYKVHPAYPLNGNGRDKFVEQGFIVGLE